MDPFPVFCTAVDAAEEAVDEFLPALGFRSRRTRLLLGRPGSSTRLEDILLGRPGSSTRLEVLSMFAMVIEY
jgi:hypothetical protein